MAQKEGSWTSSSSHISSPTSRLYLNEERQHQNGTSGEANPSHTQKKTSKRTASTKFIFRMEALTRLTHKGFVAWWNCILSLHACRQDRREISNSFIVFFRGSQSFKSIFRETTPSTWQLKFDGSRTAAATSKNVIIFPPWTRLFCVLSFRWALCCHVNVNVSFQALPFGSSTFNLIAFLCTHIECSRDRE